MCTLRDLIDMGNNIIKFLVYIGVFIGVVMIAWGGFNLVLSQGNESAMEKAKSRIWNVVIGLLIVLLSYLIVETVLNVFTGDGFDTWGI
jgi:Trk-type K+ transport system membrane component